MRHLNPVQIHKHALAGGDVYTITLDDACVAGSRIVVVGGGGAQTTVRFTDGAGTAFTRRAQALSSIDVSVHDAVAVGGETALHVTLNGAEHVTLSIYHTDLGAYVAGSGQSGVVGAASSTDFQGKAGLAATITTPSVLFGGWGVGTSTVFDDTYRFRQMGPSGHLWMVEGHQPGGGTPHIIASGVADVDTTHSYPVDLAAGQYKATSVWVGGAESIHSVQAAYEDATGIPSNPVPANDIVRENKLPGTYFDNWSGSTNATSSTIAGYVKSTSYEPGDTVEFAVDSTGNPFRVEVFRLGYYGWEPFAARQQCAHRTGTVVTQPAPTVDSTLGSTHCAWTTNATWTIPADAVPGVYYVLYRRTDDTSKFASGHFTVRGDPAGQTTVVVPDCTYQAYNLWGATTDAGARFTPGVWSGKSLYADGSEQTNDAGSRAYAVSFDRPYSCQSTQANTYLFDADQPWICWAEAQGYDLTYVSDVDLDKTPALLTTASTAIMLGHQEYLTAAQWSAFAAAPAAGVNLLVNGSNIALWHTRFDAADTQRRTIICYKESLTRDEGPGWTGTGYDPGGYTGTWRDPSNVDGSPNPDYRKENTLTGQMFVLSAPVIQRFVVPFANKAVPAWRNNTAVQALTTGQTWQAPAGTIGDEADAADGTAGQPANLVNLCPSPISGTSGANAAGTVYTTTVNPTCGWTMWRHGSGAIVANTGSWRAGQGLTRWAQSALGGFVTASSVDYQNAWLAWLYDLGMVPATPRAMRAGLETAPTIPSTGAPAGPRNNIAKAYGLTVPPTSGLLVFFLQGA
ncbi:MAG: hypothetical protein M3443_08085 [Actinomycetota bacterium]|nr:hypothetical protein [Actinomycetota bacterium]